MMETTQEEFRQLAGCSRARVENRVRKQIVSVYPRFMKNREYLENWVAEEVDKFIQRRKAREKG